MPQLRIREEARTMSRPYKRHTTALRIALPEVSRDVLASCGPYTLREDGFIEGQDGVTLANCRPNPGAEECEWDRALVELLNEIVKSKPTG